MAEVIEMPKLSDTMEEGAIANWLFKEGEFIEEGAAFVEIETDKATMEYNAPSEGVLLKILVPAGKTCALNAPICVLGEKGEKYDPEILGDKTKVKKESAKPSHDSSEKTESRPTSKSEEKKGAPAKASANDGRIKSSPLARKMAKEHGLSLAEISGSGPSGRVVVRDVDQALHSGSGQTSKSSSVRTQDFGAQEDVLVPTSMMRRTIAKRLHAAKNDAPHFYLTVSADMTKTNAWRESLNQVKDKPKVSVNDLVVMAVSRALALHPGVNASWEGEHIRQFGSVHVAVAVALPTGLVTPVVRHTNQKGLRDIASEVRELVGKAREGKLGNEDYAGGTFTISNLGMFGIEEFTAIINPPQAAILAVGATIDTPTVVKGEIKVVPKMKMTMSCDHRVVDGALGAQFLQTLVNFLEDPLMMLA